jgi:hypothetical protein
MSGPRLFPSGRKFEDYVLAGHISGLNRFFFAKRCDRARLEADYNLAVKPLPSESRQKADRVCQSGLWHNATGGFRCVAHAATFLAL